MTRHDVHDVLGIGFGPSNLALAIYAEENLPGLRVHFLEREPEPQWQSQLQVSGADIQNHPLRDLATPTNPRSRFTFPNYLHEHDRLFEHLNLGYEFPLRMEYEHYVRWASYELAHLVEFGTAARDVRWVDGVFEVEASNGCTYRARNLCVGTGRPPRVPDVFAESWAAGQVWHTNRYRDFKQSLRPAAGESVAVIGSAQSAVEVVLDLYESFPGLRIENIYRSFSPKLKDTSQFTYEWVFPDFVDTYFHSSPQRKSRLRGEIHRANYASVDGDVLSDYYRKLYVERNFTDRARLSARRLTEVREVSTCDDGIALRLSGVDGDGASSTETFDHVVLATGYLDIGMNDGRYRYPPVLDGIGAEFVTDAADDVITDRDYRIRSHDEDCRVYLHGLCEFSHGFGDSGSFSSVAFRSKVIAESVAAARATREPSPSITASV